LSDELAVATRGGVANRTLAPLGHAPRRTTSFALAMTNVFVSSANERVIDGAAVLLVNELEGEELRKHLALEAIVPHMPSAPSR